MVRRMAEAPRSAAAAQESIEQQAAAAQQRRHHHTVAPQYNSASITGHVHEKMAHRTAREQALMLQQAAAGQQQGQPVADGRCDGHLRRREQSAGAQKSAQVAMEQEMRQWQLTEAEQRTATTGQDMLMRQAAAAAAALKYPHSAELCQELGLDQQLHDQLMAKAANRTTTAVEAATREQDMMMMRQAAAATQKYPDWAKLYHELGLNQQLHDHDHLTANAANRAAAEEDAMELTRNQNVMTTQLHHDQAGQ
jgi:hypothetical protein